MYSSTSDNALNASLVASKQDTKDTKNTQENERRACRMRKGCGSCKRSSSGGCKAKKGCCACALLGVPIFIVLSPVIIPTMLVRRAFGYKCKGCKRNTDKDGVPDVVVAGVPPEDVSKEEEKTDRM